MLDKSDNEIKLHMRFIKNYKKNTLAIFFSFTLTFMLLAALLILIHTNHRLDNIQQKTVLTPSDCNIKGLTLLQARQLKEDKDIEHTAVSQENYIMFERNQQNIFLQNGDAAMITMMAQIIEGRLPEKEGEIVAEKWALLNMGIEPVINQDFVINDFETGEVKECRLVGILSDMTGNKKYGTLNLYGALEEKTQGQYLAYLQLKKDVSYDAKMKSLRSELGIKKKQIKKCPAKEDFQELYETDVKMISVILIVCLVVFYGIYRIAFIAREKQYGILRAVGMKRAQLQKMILQELYQIYLVSVPVGIGAGFLISYFIMEISGDRDLEIYFFNERVEFVPVIPVWPLLLCIILMALLIGITGYGAGKKVIKRPVIEVISGKSSLRRKGSRLFGIDKGSSKAGTLFHMGCKYILQDMKTSCFAVLTICVGVTLFTGLAYQTQLLKIYREDTKEMWYLNGAYAMNMLSFQNVKEGISRKSAESVENIQDIASVKTASGLPIRVVYDDNIKQNNAYYDELNATLREYYGYENAGNDNSGQVYKSILYGYNKNALKELEKYVISGDFDPDSIGEDEIILSVLSMDDTADSKNKNIPGYFREGTPLMEYKAGDEIQIKYRADLQTDSYAYNSFTDTDAEYIYKTYKIAAIVSFAYMYDCNRIVYPLLITSDQNIQSIAPESGIQCMYVDRQGTMSISREIELEQQLIRICSQNENVSTRSLISDIKQNEMFYQKQMIYVYGVAIVTFVLVLINMINNLTYRMETRTREISMLRAIGMSVAMTKKMLLFENMVLAMAAIAAAFILTKPVLRYLYHISYMRAFGHMFQYAYGAFAGVSFVSLFICMFLSFRILKTWKTKHIVEGIGTAE